MGLEERSALDFNQIPFIQAVMEKRASHPTAGTGDSGPLNPGRFYYNTTDSKPYIYTVNGWVEMTPAPGATGPAGPTGAAGANSTVAGPTGPSASSASPTFTGTVIAPTIDTVSAGTLSLGTTNASTVNLGTATSTQTINIGTGTGTTTINIGGAGDTVAIAGTLTSVNTTNTEVADKVITLNKGGVASSGSATGLEIEENAVVTGYIKSTGDRAGFDIKAPASAGIVTITPGATGGSVWHSGNFDPTSKQPTLGYTPVNKVGDTGIGNLSMGALTATGAYVGAATGTNTPMLTIGAGNTGAGTATIRMGSTPREWDIKVGANPYPWSLSYVGTDAPLADILKFTSTGAATFASSVSMGALTATSIIKSGGTSSQFLKADGSVDAIAYASTALNQTWSKAQRGAVVALTDAAPVVLDLSLGNNFSLLMASGVGSIRQLQNPSNIVGGQSGIIAVTQDGTGSRLLTYGSYYKFVGGTAPVLSTAANAVDYLSYYVESATRVFVSILKDVK